jgi:hypothetical protein
MILDVRAFFCIDVAYGIGTYEKLEKYENDACKSVPFYIKLFIILI